MDGLGLWLILAAAILFGVTAAAAASLDAAMHRARPILATLAASLLIPASGAILINLARGGDRHGFGLVAMLFFVATSLPLSLAVSVATMWLRRRSPSSKTRA